MNEGFPRCILGFITSIEIQNTEPWNKRKFMNIIIVKMYVVQKYRIYFTIKNKHDWNLISIFILYLT